MRNLDDVLATFSDEARARIMAEAQAIIAEEISLRELRELRKQSQAQLAERLGVKQSEVSRLERRTDMYVGTLRRMIQAMGGELEIVATFPDRAPVRITQFRDLNDG